MHPTMQHLARLRAEDKRQEDERRLLQDEAKTRRKVRDQDRTRASYGNSSSYAPASDACSAPFVPAAESYSPPPAEPVSSIEAAGGSFDGGGASGDY